jgi:putative heme-binding domain-containing protein
MRLLTAAFATLTMLGSSVIAADGPVDSTGKLFPTPAELAKMTGDATKGQMTFSMFCSSCHQMNGVGIDFGPNFADLGSRKSREVIAEGILYPNKVIEPGYEGVTITLENDDTHMGVVTAESDTEVTIKQMGGANVTVKKVDIVSRVKMTNSLMMDGLYRGMTVDDLVNVVEYLAAQKKK